MKKRFVLSAITGMGFGFPVTLLCMTMFGGFNETVQECLIWMIASALYGILSGALFDSRKDLPQMAAIGIHCLGCAAITMAAALLNGYVSDVGDVLPILIPMIVIYAAIWGICILLNKQTEKKINRALKEK